jgi:hypothetical protein
MSMKHTLLLSCGHYNTRKQGRKQMNVYMCELFIYPTLLAVVNHPKIQASHASYQVRMPQTINTPSIFKLQLPMVPSSVIYAPEGFYHPFEYN